MSLWQIIWRSLVYHWRVQGAVVLGVAAATAVLTGSLLVGASMRSSLKSLTLRRLGQIDEVLVTQRFIEAAPALTELSQQRSRVAGLIWLPGSTLETVPQGTNEPTRRAANVQVLAGERLAEFWPQAAAKFPDPGAGQIVINQSLASDLGLSNEIGVLASPVQVTLRLPRFESLSSDSPLGEKEDLTMALPRLSVLAIMPDEGPGRFSLQPSQIAPRNAIVSRADLEPLFEAEGKINAIWLGDDSIEDAPSTLETTAVSRVLKPSLSDYGILIKRSRIERSAEQASEPVTESDVVADALYVSSDRMIIEPPLALDLEQALAEWQPKRLMTYLANDIGKFDESGQAMDGRSGVPFSMVTAVDFDDEYSLEAIDGSRIEGLQDDQIVLNEWTARDLGVQVGDRIRLTFFRPETTHGQTSETHADFVLSAIAKLTVPAAPYARRRDARFSDLPTLANDPALTPEVPGVTDQDSIENWDLPFPTADRIRREDDEYWQFYRTTPKAFVSLNQGRDLWGSRFGELTGYRIETNRVSEDRLREQVLATLHASERRHGLEFMGVKQLGLQSASGTTPFDGLFLGLSLFVIVAALMLIVLLFRLGLERRLEEIGTWLAIGFAKRRVARVLIGEGTIVSVIGGAIGTGLGVGYAGLMIWGLQTWWVGAIRTPFLQLAIDPSALVMGFVGSVLVCVATIGFTVWRFRTGAIRDLLAGRLESGLGRRTSASRFYAIIAMLSGAMMIVAVAAGSRLGGEMQAGAFLGAGAAALTMLLALLSGWMRRDAGETRSVSLAYLAWRNAVRNPTRSLLTIGLVGAATFLIGGVSAFRMAPTERGTGGFALQATTSRPIFSDLNDEQERASRFGSDASELAGTRVLAFRWRRGDDASCNNPFRANQPQVLGVSADVIAYFEQDGVPDFGWAGVSSDDPQVKQHPWRLLSGEQVVAEGEAIPVVIDKNTAMWGLQVYSVGQEFTIDYEETGPLKLKAVGFLDNTVLQGRILMSDREFRRRFPNEEGDSFFLISTNASTLPSETEPTRESGSQAAENSAARTSLTDQNDDAREARIRALFEDRLGDVGFSTLPTRQVLEELLAVQNTYLSTFQALGALGLLLGTFGLATVQLRSVLERRRELALMQAIGFSRARLVTLVFWENAWLLVMGLGVGASAATMVLVPHWWLGDANVPWRDLVAILALVGGIGLATGTLATRSILGLRPHEALAGRS